MGGSNQSEPRLDALEHWLFGVDAPEPMLAADDPAAVRGRQVFVDAGCETCHGGPALTNSTTVDVGTGGLFQVPSLVGIGYRAPFIHTGCADTLAERFDPSCGGTAHGAVAGLSEAQIDDMVAYLETL
jgi:cytochrome c peroxidase